MVSPAVKLAEFVTVAGRCQWLGRVDQASGFMSDCFRMVSFPRAGGFVCFVHCSGPRTWSCAGHRGAEQMFFVFVLERVAESFRKCTLMFRSMGDMGQGRGREAQWKPSLRETTIESWNGKGSHGTLFISSRSASI